jgi:DNA-binding NarL/FixJ family response regulator
MAGQMAGQTVAVAAHVRVLREALAAALVEHHGAPVVAVECDQRGALELAASKARATVVDTTSEGSLAFILGLKAAAPSMRVVALGLEAGREALAPFVEAGVTGFVMAGATIADVVRVLESVLRIGKGVDDELAFSLLRTVTRDGVGNPGDGQVRGIDRLTERERELAALVATGLSNQEIAAELSISIPTVKTHVHHILDKLGVARRVELAALLHVHAAPASSNSPGCHPGPTM